MIGYVCKYTPIEIFEAFGEEVKRIEPNTSNFDHADALIHPNMCTYSKAVLEDALQENYEGIIFTTCCDSMRRLYDTLKKEFPNKFIYLLDLPHKVNALTVNFYQHQLESMIQSYEAFKHRTFDSNVLVSLLAQRKSSSSHNSSTIQIGLMGARCSKGISNLLREKEVNILFDLTCTGINRYFTLDSQAPLHSYASTLLGQFPCLRMEDSLNRKEYLKQYEHQLSGLIYHTVKFCDNYSYEYAYLKNHVNVPILKIETDYSSQCEGQIKTRIEAFIESLQSDTLHTSSEVASTSVRDSNTFYVMGIDSGSTSTNAVILNNHRELVAFSVVRTGAKSGESAQRALKDVLDQANLAREDLSLIVSTGYGRVSIPFAHKNVTEISCHGKGAHYLNPKIRTIIDIGGQDSKAIKLNEVGEVIDFVMNDKCAAGTGRFLEMIARTLEMDIKDMGPESLKWKEDISISSMCSVFAESEVISLIAQNKEQADIIHGIHKAIAAKSVGLVSRIGKEPDYMMTGGVAKNIGMIRAIEEKLGNKLYIAPEPEIVGALGAALFALEELEKY